MLSAQVLSIDAPVFAEQIAHSIRDQVLGTLRRRGVVVGLSGGVDSAVVAALCVRALGSDKVLGLFMPERDTSEDALRLGQEVANSLGMEALVEDITPALQGVGCYRRQEEAIREVFPEYGEGWRCKLSLPSVLEGNRVNLFQLTVQSPDGQQHARRLPARAYLQLVAATNFKQRVRKMLEYYHADRLHRAVAGTPNRLEYDQGFFVKQGDGAADLKPIAHLYKTQVYALAEYLNIPEEVRRRPPTTDTYSLPQTQEEFFFSLPYAQMDLCLYAHDQGLSEEEVAQALGLAVHQVDAVYRDIEAKRRATHYLHEPPLFVQPLREG
ncbi:NAD(+) synthase [Hyalangium rubrum]|uniref:NH(3)-dependent NAD(+) synthetase n=1 Tax=Hyalangium rubrum TaxID=3103134 RepID=A0ABU5HEF8_9BACT|nr:NAD(+) synthase [Hyalangium sp. s54d21]MDY7231859.1 NAD(+) synthase [Hyalangium sp. s54d21]